MEAGARSSIHEKPEPTFPCKVCDEVFNEITSIQDHILDTHNLAVSILLKSFESMLGSGEISVLENDINAKSTEEKPKEEEVSDTKMWGNLKDFYQFYEKFISYCSLL